MEVNLWSKGRSWRSSLKFTDVFEQSNVKFEENLSSPPSYYYFIVNANLQKFQKGKIGLGVCQRQLICAPVSWTSMKCKTKAKKDRQGISQHFSLDANSTSFILFSGCKSPALDRHGQLGPQHFKVGGKCRSFLYFFPRSAKLNLGSWPLLCHVTKKLLFYWPNWKLTQNP